jgi:hypothetical protein
MINGIPGIFCVGLDPSVKGSLLADYAKGGLFADYISQKHKEGKILSCEKLEDNLLKILIRDALADEQGMQLPIDVEIRYNTSTGIVEYTNALCRKIMPQKTKIIEEQEKTITAKFTEQAGKTVLDKVCVKEKFSLETLKFEEVKKIFSLAAPTKDYDEDKRFQELIPPSELTPINPTYIDSVSAKFIYTDVVINPVIDDQEFVLSFPEGARVFDYVTYPKVGVPTTTLPLRPNLHEVMGRWKSCPSFDSF